MPRYGVRLNRSNRISGPQAASAVALAIAVATACRPGERSFDMCLEPERLDSMVDWVDEITLEENREVINVYPVVDVAPDGTILVADISEARVRIYDPRGKLIRQFGRRGSGPGEFLNPIATRWLPSGHILVVNFQGTLAVFDTTGTVRATHQPPVHPVFDALALSDRQVLIIGRGEGQPPVPLVHLWDLDSGRVVWSALQSHPDEPTNPLLIPLGWAGAGVRRGSVAAVNGLRDTLHLFELQGGESGSQHIPFARWELPPIGPEVGRSMEGMEAWLEKVWRLGNVHWLEDGSFLIQAARSKGPSAVWKLLWMTAGGERICEVDDTPRLLALQGERLYFVKPGAEVPNRWAVARLRSPRR